MPAIGMGLLWGGYTLALWGYCQLQGYKIALTDLVVPGRYTGTWPPPPIDTPVAPPGAAPGTHPGDMPWSYPDPTNPRPVT